MLDTVRMHPNLVTANKDFETTTERFAAYYKTVLHSLKCNLL